MKRYLALMVVVALCSHASAGTYRIYKFSTSDVATNATESVDSKTAITGKPVAFSFSGGTNMTVVLRTTAGIGISPESLTLVAATNAMTFYRPLPEGSAVYLHLDKVTMATYGTPVETNHYGRDVATGMLLIEVP